MIFLIMKITITLSRNKIKIFLKFQFNKMKISVMGVLLVEREKHIMTNRLSDFTLKI